MNNMKVFALLLSVALLAGCSTAGDYYKSVDASNARNVEIAKAQAVADVARYQALVNIAQNGDATAKVAATMALALGANTGRQAQAAVAQPMQSEALQWASVLVPGVTQGLGIYYNAKQAINASNNATALGMNTNGTFAQFASEINAPVVVHPEVVVTPSPEPVVVQPVVVQPEIVRPEVVPQMQLAPAP
jgi:hypothetical protein